VSSTSLAERSSGVKLAKKVLYSFQLFANQAMAGTTVQSQTMSVPFLDNLAIEAKWTGTPNGTFQLLGSVSGLNFNVLPVIFPPATGSAGSWTIPFVYQGCQYLQLQYTGSSSTGTLNAYIGGKEV
jgi:hypothetical protein